MLRLLLILSFLVTGIGPLGVGAYLANRGDYYLSACCFLIAVCSFQQLYYFLQNNEISETLLQTIADQQKEIDAQKEAHDLEIKQLTHNLGEIFSVKMDEQKRKSEAVLNSKIDEQNQKLEAQRKRLAEVNKTLEQRNKEIWTLKRYDD